MTYEAPGFTELGTLEELTAQGLNKVGPAPDLLTAITNNVVIGSFVVI